VDIVQSLVGGDAPSERCPHHASDQLRDVGVVLSLAERHQHLGARTIPSGRDSVLAEHDPNIGIVLDVLWLDVADRVISHADGGVICKSVDDVAVG